MNSFIETLNHSGETFLDFAWPIAWQSSLLIATLLAFDFLFRRKVRASVRYAAWLVVLVKLILPPTLALPTSPAWWLLHQPPVIQFKPQMQNYTVSYDDESLPPASLNSLPAYVPPKPVMTSAAWLLVLSAATSMGLLAWLLIRWWQITRRVSRAKTSERLTAIAVQTRLLAGVRARPPVKLTTDTMSPAVCGLFRPAILIPQTLAENFSDEQLRAVLLHELIHLRRRDVWLNFLQSLLQIVYWWHPLVWLANARIRRAREEAVDDAVMLALAGGAEAYAPTLLQVAKLALNRPLVSLGLVGIMESRSALRQRIERLVDFRPPRRAGLTLVSIFGILAFTAVAVPMGGAPGATEEQVLPASAVPIPAVATPDTNRPPILIEAQIYQLRAVDFEKAVSGLKFNQVGQDNNSWWSASPAKFNQLYENLRASGLKPISRPRVLTRSGWPAEFYTGNDTNSLKFDCLPLMTNGLIELAAQGFAVAKSASISITNQFSIKTLMEDHGGMVVRMDNAEGSIESNVFMVTIGVQISSYPKTGSVSASQEKTNDLTMATEAAIEDLKNQLAKGSSMVRASALAKFAFSPITVGEAENPALREVLPILIQATTDKDEWVRSAAVMALGRIHSPDQTVIEALGNLITVEANLNTATIAATELKEAGSAAAPAVPDLIQVLRDRRDAGVEYVGDARVGGNVALGTAFRRAVIEALGNIGPAAKEAVPTLRQVSKDTWNYSLEDHVFAAKALWQITGEADESLPILANALKNNDSFWAADVLGLMGPASKPAISALRDALQNGSLYTRLRSAIALNKIEPGFSVPMPLLLDSLKDRNPETRLEAAETIWSIHHDPETILPTLLGLIQQDEQQPFHMAYQCFAAISLLGEIGPPAQAAVPRLKEIAQDNQVADLSKRAVEALEKIERQTGPSSQSKLQFAGPQGFPSSSETVTGILSNPNFNKALHELQKRNEVKGLPEPEVEVETRTGRYVNWLGGVSIPLASEASAETSSQTTPKAHLLLRGFKVDTQTFIASLGLKPLPGDFGETSPPAFYPALRKFVTDLGVNLESPSGKTISFNEKRGLLYVKATESDLDTIGRSLQTINMLGPQIHIKARFLEVPKGTFAGLANMVIVTNQPNQLIGILANGDFQVALRGLQTHSEELAEPEVLTLSGRQTQVRATEPITVVTNFALQENGTNTAVFPQTTQVETGPMIDVVPYVLSDGYTVNLTAIASVTNFLGYDQPPDQHISRDDTSIHLPVILPVISVQQAIARLNLWDNQTLVLGNLPKHYFSDGKEVSAEPAYFAKQGKQQANGQPAATDKELIVFVTVTLVDPAGNRIHSDDDVPFAKTEIPPQPQIQEGINVIIP